MIKKLILRAIKLIKIIAQCGFVCMMNNQTFNNFKFYEMKYKECIFFICAMQMYYWHTFFFVCSIKIKIKLKFICWKKKSFTKSSKYFIQISRICIKKKISLGSFCTCLLPYILFTQLYPKRTVYFLVRL